MGLTQDTAGVGGTAEAGDLFGDRLAFAAPGLGDPTTRLVVGVPAEDGAAADSGMVQVFPVTDLDAEVTYSQNSPGVPGAWTRATGSGPRWPSCPAPASALFCRCAGRRGQQHRHGQRDPARRRDAALLGARDRRRTGGGASRFGDALGSVHGGTT